MSLLQAKLAQVNLHLREGRAQQALAMCRRLAQNEPANPGVNSMMSVILVQLDEPRQALHYAQRAAEALPDEPVMLVRFGHLLCILNRAEDALPHLRRAVALDPRASGPRGVLSAALISLARYTDAYEACLDGGTVPLDDPNLVGHAAHALLNLSRADDAIALYRDAIARHPRSVLLHANLCNAMMYARRLDPKELLDAHVRHARLAEETRAPRPPTLDPRPDRPLRIGVVSPDLRRHSVAYFIAALFEHHDPRDLLLHAYDTLGPGRGDDMTEHLRSHADAWHSFGNTTYKAMAAKIRADRIDVLVELSGLTGAHSMDLLPHRPAPAVVTYLGYPGTTGLSTVDFRVVDSITDPAPAADAFATEKLLRLDPCFLCFTPPGEAPDVAPRPADAPPVFASFNSAQKINDPLLRLWARVLDAVPGSRLLLKAVNFKDPHLREATRDRLSRFGLAPDRVEIVEPAAGTRDHLAVYHRADIALDTFPYHGTTTTCESLLMGVPVVSMVGEAHASRVGASLLSAVGLRECLASNEGEYIRIAGDLARDRDGLARLRGELRPRLLASPLCDGAGFTARLSRLLRSAWMDIAGRPA